MRTANLKEWCGKTDDSKPAPYVRLRVFNKYDGICYLSKRKIVPGDKWDLEHVVALCNGGENRESNMAPALVAPHKIKTKQDRATKAKNDHVRMKHIGIREPSRLQSRGFPPRKPQLTASKPLQKGFQS
jgi:5-methylcytosine-specific restriction endonuclease McrA